ncbi:ATP-binding protein [Streptomyces fructofermentans]|uniref:Histidine kinase/HSP90-like ATPase domain-containing protein n=1 Tax=Streptomyces fructofermentans TaxID=152141 RepID=A0A918NP85_9ACTN|nr:ATP-binding protein [Streptomyces fructofermentans]GGX85131.1 hypothetical protein GCM10010515_60720 [Streptomyces fructofermentans]
MDRTDTSSVAPHEHPSARAPGDDLLPRTHFEPADGIPLPAGTVVSAAAAREHARAVVLRHWNSASRGASEAALIDLLLVVSELTTNAIRHGGGLAAFEVTPTGEGVRLTVQDNSDVVPAVAFGSGELPVGHHGNGYGWPLIIRLAREITITPGPGGGKTISVLVPLA